MKPADEKKLVEACLRSEALAQKALYDHFSPQLLGFCMRYANSREDGEDIMIEGFTKIFAHLSEFRFDSSLVAWMKRIMLNTAISHLRQNHKHYNNIPLEDVSENTCDSLQTLPTDKLQEKDFLALFQQMPELYRVIFNLHVIEGYSHKEIGEMLEIRESTSRSNLTRARNWLKERLS